MTKTLNSLDRNPLLNRRIMLVGAGAATAGVLASLLYSAIWAPRTDTAAKAKRRSPGKSKLPAEELAKPGPLPDLAIGRADAPVTIIEYADLACPACAHFHNTVLPVLKEKYIDKGHVRLLFREYVTNTHSVVASLTVRCAGTEKAPTLISAIFSRQDDWRQAKSMEELKGKLFSLGQQVGLTRQAFNACTPTRDGKLPKEGEQLFTDLAAAYERARHGFGVNQTPTFFVNGKKLDGAAIEDFDKAIAPLINKG